MNSIYNSTGNKFNFTLNIVLHISILFLILSLFFIFYVSKLIKKKIDQELSGIIQNYFDKSFESLNPVEQKLIKITLKDIPFDNLIKLYSQPDKKVETYNRWLFIMLIAVNIFFFIFIIILISSPYLICNKSVPIKNILLENITIFVFVGIVELLFFKFVALKYIPAPPSLMINSIIDGIKKYL
jgi:hypothetical protein